jgi:hypothetical protein
VKFSNAILSFSLFWVLSIFIYASVWNCGFVFDTVEWFNNFNALQWSGFKVNFHDLAVRYFFDIVSLMVINLFGKHQYLYFLLYTFLHALAAWQLFAFSIFALKGSIDVNSKMAALLVALLFLFSPYNTEVVVWRVGLIYLLIVNLLLVLLRLAKNYFDTGDVKWLSAYFIIYVCALLTHEIAMFFPLIWMVLAIKFYIQQNKPKVAKLKLQLVLPSFILIGCYLFLNKLILGKWIGHYGAATHFNFDIVLLLSTFNKYIAKLALLAQFWNQQHKIALYHFFEKPFFCYLSLGFYGLVALWFLLRQTITFNGIVFGAFAFAVLIAPVLNLYFVDWMPIHGDRLGYVASGFFYLFVVALLLTLFKEAGYFFIVILLILEIVGLNSIMASWNNSERIMTSIHHSFKIEADKEYVILAAADNFNGAYMYRCLSETPFAASMKLKADKDITKQCTEVLKFNMVSVHSGVVVEKLSDNQLKMYFTEGGSWWWKYAQGASDFENENYKVEIKDNVAYVSFKQKQPHAIYLFQQADSLLKLSNF